MPFAIFWQTPTPEHISALNELQSLIRQDLLVEQGGRAAVITLLLTTISVTFGRSLLLLANQVRPSRFLFSLIFSALTFVATLGLWTAAIYFVGRTFFQMELALQEIAVVVIVSFAPLVHAYLGILPYVGGCIVRFLYIQSALILFIMLWALGFGAWGALVVLLLGVAVTVIGQVTILEPLYWLQNKVAGKNLQRRYRNIIAGSYLELES